MAKICYDNKSDNAPIKLDNLKHFYYIDERGAIKIIEAIRILDGYIFKQHTIDAANLAYQEFEKLCNSYKPNVRDRYLPLINMRLRTFVLEFRVYLEHWEKHIKHENTAYELFKKLTSDAYDHNDEYVLVYGLRNFAAHIDNLINYTFAGQDNGVFEPLISRSALLEHKDAFNTKTVSIIDHYDTEAIHLRSIMTKSIKLLNDIHNKMMAFYLNQEVIDAAKIMGEAYNVIKRKRIHANRWFYIEFENLYIMCQNSYNDICYPNGNGFSSKYIDWERYTSINTTN